MKIFDWMHRRMKHDMNYYSKVPQGKGGTTAVEMSQMEFEDKSIDQCYGARRDALLLVELGSEAPASASAIYQVLGMDGILTIGTLGSTPHHQFRRLGKEPTIMEEDEEGQDRDGKEELAKAQHRISLAEKPKKDLVRPREKLALQSIMPGLPLQLNMAAHQCGRQEEKFMERPLLAKAEEEILELEKERLTLMDLFVMSDEELEDDDQYGGHGTTAAKARNDNSAAVTKGGASGVWKKIRHLRSACAIAPAAVDKMNENHSDAKHPGVVYPKKKEREGTSRKFGKLIKNMTRKKIHPDVDILKAEAETCVHANKNMHKEDRQHNQSNKTNFKCTPFVY